MREGRRPAQQKVMWPIGKQGTAKRGVTMREGRRPAQQEALAVPDGDSGEAGREAADCQYEPERGSPVVHAVPRCPVELQVHQPLRHQPLPPCWMLTNDDEC